MKPALITYYALVTVIMAGTAMALVIEPNADFREEMNSPLNSNIKCETMKWSFEAKLTEYKKMVNSLRNNTKLLFIFTLFSIAVLRGSDDDFKIPNIEISIPKYLTLAILIIGLLYIWLEFGFLFNRIIYSRLSLNVIHEFIASETQSDQLHPMVSIQSAFQDGGIIDAWFVAYEGYLREYGFPTAARVFCKIYVCMFGGIYGVSHGIMACLIKRYIVAKHVGYARSSTSLFAGWIFLGVSLFVISFTHMLFHFGGAHNCPSFQVTTIVSMIVTFSLIGIFSRGGIGVGV